jgi:hypothetical protein
MGQLMETAYIGKLGNGAATSFSSSRVVSSFLKIAEHNLSRVLIYQSIFLLDSGRCAFRKVI